MGDQVRRALGGVAGTLVAATVLAGCAVGDLFGSRLEGVEAPEGPLDTSRTVSLGEEFLLADLLALDVDVVASTATVPAEGFSGITGYDTSGITALSATEPDLEQVLAADPTLIVATDFVVDEVGRGALEEIAPVVVVGTGPWRELLTDLAGALDRTDEAEVALADYDAAVAAARAELADLPVVSVATVYPGESVAVWTGGDSPVTRALADLGIPLAPSADDVDADENGRAFVSSEEVTTLLTGEVLLLLQTDTVEGETASVRAALDGGLFATLPAVRADRVEQLDRLGYPGLPGRVDAVEDLVAALDGR